MSLHPATALYDPRRLKKADFLAGFIARADLAEHLLAQLGKSVTDGEPRHRLILGVRGMGKTSLLRRIAFGIADTPALAAALLPLTFREEQYNVRSLDQLWRNCGEALAEWREENGDAEGAAALDRALEGPEWRGVEQAGAAFRALMEATGKRAVLLIDNLDLILDALPPEQHWQWRRHLQAPGGPILLGAATQAPRQLGDRAAAFYEFLRLERLDALSDVELRRCLERMAQNRGEAGAPVLETLRREPARLRVLHNLTGGNPRILALLYQVLERAESDTVFTDLEGVLDQVTPLYKARVEELRTDLQRAMLDAVALHWDPITARKLAEATGEPVTTVSSQLSRLQEAGYVEEVPTSGARAGYQLAERFFNIWYLMRHGTRRTRQQMVWLTGFLAEFFSLDELRAMRARLAPDQASRWHEMLSDSLTAALALPRKAAVAEAVARGSAAQNAGRIEEAEMAFREAIAGDPGHVDAWNALGRLLAQRRDKPEEAEQAFREAIAQDPGQAASWNNLGIMLANQRSRPGEAEAAFREAIRQDAKHASPWNNLGVLLAEQQGRPDEAEAAFREAIARDPKAARAWRDLGALLAHHLGRPEEAETAFREAIARDPKFAQTWNSLGNLLADQRDQLAAAEAAYREAIALDPQGLSARCNLIWLDLRRGVQPLPAARDALAASLPPVGIHLLDAGIALAQDNLGTAMTALGAALDLPLQHKGMTFHDDLRRLLRLAHQRGHGEHLIAWLQSSGHAEKQAPLHAAFIALVRGEATLRDINPETRAVAERIHRSLRPHPPTPPAAPPRRRGRPRQA